MTPEYGEPGRILSENSTEQPGAQDCRAAAGMVGCCWGQQSSLPAQH